MAGWVCPSWLGKAVLSGWLIFSALFRFATIISFSKTFFATCIAVQVCLVVFSSVAPCA